ncbi:MAG: TadE/TadG family type IV pilus assembly protein [Stappiaceae bacterium]
MLGYNELREQLRRFQREQSGSIMIITGFMIVVLIVVGGAAVDYARAVSTRSTLANAIDSATLAAAKALSAQPLSDGEVRTIVEEHFAANAGDFYNDIDFNIVNVDVDDDSGLVTVDASAEVPTFFVKLASIDTLDVANVSQARYSRYNVELALVLDITGSMGGQKIVDLKDAAKTLVDILLPPDYDEDKGRVKISVVPYSYSVKLDAAQAKLATEGNNFIQNASGDKTYYNCLKERTGPDAYTDLGPSAAPMGWNKSCADAEILPLDDDADKIKRAIDDLRTGGMTSGHIGFVWGWYTLSPDWSSVWPAGSKPVNYGDDDTLKFILYMTDGTFNRAYSVEQNPIVTGDSITGAGFATKNNSPSSSNRAKDLCDSYDANDATTIYSIAFQATSSAESIMRYCASSPDKYFDASDGDALKLAFERIAKDIQQIYLSM